MNRFEAKGIKKNKNQQILRIIKMKQDRIRAGEPYKQDLDEFPDFIADSGHVVGITILKRFVQEWKLKRKSRLELESIS